MAVTVDAEGLQPRAREAWHTYQREQAAAAAARDQEFREARMQQLADRIFRWLGVKGVQPRWEEELGAVAVVDGLLIAQDEHRMLRLVKRCPRCGGQMLSHGFDGLVDLGRALEMSEETRFLHRCPTDEPLHRPAPPPPPEPTIAERLLQALEAYITALVDERVPGVSG